MHQVTKNAQKDVGQMHRCVCTACRVYHQSDDLKLFSSAKSMLNTQKFLDLKQDHNELSRYTRELFANT